MSITTPIRTPIAGTRRCVTVRQRRTPSTPAVCPLTPANPGRWVTVQVGRFGRTVNEVAVELGCDWHTINDAVIAYGEALIDDDPERIGDTTALGLDETLFVKLGRWRTKQWATSIVDVAAGRLLDIVPGRTAARAVPLARPTR